MASGFLKRDRARKARGKIQKSHHRFLNSLLAHQATLFNVGGVYTEAQISRSKDHWGSSLSLAIQVEKAVLQL